MNLHETVRNLPAVKARAKVSVETRRAQWRLAVPGMGLVLGGMLLPKFLGFPWQVGIGVSAFGAFMIDRRMVLDFAKAIAQFMSALGGKSPDA